MTDHYTELMAPRLKRGMKTAILALFISICLAFIKILSGIFGRSYALIADGIESCLDILGALIVYGGLRIAANPPDEKHPYGHGKAESLAGLTVALLLLGAALLIAFQSVREILDPDHAPRAWTLAVLVLVVIVKEALFRYVRKVGDETESTAMKAEAWHHRSDALTSLAAFVGISVALVMGEGWEAADDWAALLACGIILFNGCRLLKTSVEEMMDVAPEEALSLAIRGLARTVSGVDEIETCMIRKSGPGWLVDIHIMVDGEMTVTEGHEISHVVKERLKGSEFGILNAQVHVEPHEAHPEVEIVRESSR